MKIIRKGDFKKGEDVEYIADLSEDEKIEYNDRWNIISDVYTWREKELEKLKHEGMEIDKNIKISYHILRADGISASVDFMKEDPRSYEHFNTFTYNNGNTINNIFLLENSLSISSGDYLEFIIDYKKLSKPINYRRTKFKLECDLWSRKTTWDYRDKKNTTDHFITSKGIDVTEFRNKKCQYPRFFNNYRDYRKFIDDTWNCERIIITEKDLATFENLDNKDIIKVWLHNTGVESYSCGMIESKIFSILCPDDKIMSFRSKRDIESYHNGTEVYDAHHLSLYLATD